MFFRAAARRRESFGRMARWDAIDRETRDRDWRLGGLRPRPRKGEELPNLPPAPDPAGANSAAASDDSAAQGVFEPPEGDLLKAISRNKGLIAICAILCALAGVTIGLLRPATYEAAATLQVGQVNPNSPGFASYTQSSSSLATAFSRAIAAEPVLVKIEHKLGLTPQRAVTRLSSEPIALSPAFRVIATGPSARDAMRLANVAAGGVIAYENRSNSANPQAAALLSSYRRASLALNQASEKVSQLGPEAPSEDRLEAEAELSSARVQLKAISNAYVTTVASQPPRAGFVSLLAGATSASDNRSSRVQLFGFVGLLAGIALGCAVAFRRERRRERRQAGSTGPQPA
jgi:hypothetical protein